MQLLYSTVPTKFFSSGAPLLGLVGWRSVLCICIARHS